MLKLSLIVLTFIQLTQANNNDSQELSPWNNITTESHSMDNFPADPMPVKIRHSGGFVLHIFIFMYICLGMGIVCDMYFLPSIEFISQVLRLPPDIAGATFMAMGTSAPDLFTSIIGVFVAEDDIGIGTILGSSVFNLIAVPAVCGFTVKLFCPKAPKMNKFPIIRDSFFYILAIIALIISIKDNMVDWVESTIMIGLFLIYLVLMYFNTKYSDQIEKTFNNQDVKLPSLEERSHQEWNKLRTVVRTTLSQYRRARIRGTRRIVLVDDQGQYVHGHGADNEIHWFQKNTFFKYLLFPLTLVFMISIPKPNKCSFVFTFILSIVWLGALTYVSVWMVTIIGFTLGLPDSVSGLTILAAGASVPDLIASVLIVKKAGKANMAISNSIGSNIFGILFCLSLPWLLKSIILSVRKGTVDLVATAVVIESTALPLTTSSLLVCIFALIITFYAANWRLGLTVGITFTLIYVIFVTVSASLELLLAH